MKVFAVVAFAPNPRLERAILKLFGRDHLKVAPNAWMVAADIAARDLSERLGITDGTNGSAVILAFKEYHGRGPPSMAAWIKSKQDLGQEDAAPDEAGEGTAGSVDGGAAIPAGLRRPRARARREPVPGE